MFFTHAFLQFVLFWAATNGSDFPTAKPSYDQCMRDKMYGEVAYKVDKLIPPKNQFQNNLKQCLLDAGCSKPKVINELKSLGLKLLSEETFALNGSDKLEIGMIGNSESQAQQCGTELFKEKLVSSIETCTADKLGIHSWRFGQKSLEENPGDPAVADPDRTARMHLNEMIEMALNVKSIAANVSICNESKVQKDAESCINSLTADAQYRYANYHLAKPSYHTLKTHLCQAKQTCKTLKESDQNHAKLQKTVVECIWETLESGWSGYFAHYSDCLRETSGIPINATSKLANVGKTVEAAIKEQLQETLIDILPMKLAEISKYSEENCDDAKSSSLDNKEVQHHHALEVLFSDGRFGLIILPKRQPARTTPQPKTDDSLFVRAKRDVIPLERCSEGQSTMQGILKMLSKRCDKYLERVGFNTNVSHWEGASNDCKCKNVQSMVEGLSYIDDFKVVDWARMNENWPKIDTQMVEPLVEVLSAGLLTPIKSLLSSVPSNARLSYWATKP